MKKRVLVTGASGFVGANLARRLLDEGHEVHLLLRSGYQSWRVGDLGGHTHNHEVALTDKVQLDRIVGEIHPEWVFHLAVYGAYSEQRDWRQMVQANVVSTGNLLDACMQTGFDAFINTGSSSEYGFKNTAPKEDDFLEPNSHYAVTKAAATLHCAFMARAHDLPLATLRLYSAYGPFEDPKRLIPALLIKGLEGRFPPLVSADIARDYVYVGDVCDAYIRAASAADRFRGEIFNVATGVQVRLGEIVDIVRTLLEIQAQPQWGTMPAREWDTSIWVGDSVKILREVKWSPVHSLKSGLEEFIAWLRKNPELLAHYKSELSAPGLSQ